MLVPWRRRVWTFSRCAGILGPCVAVALVVAAAAVVAVIVVAVPFVDASRMHDPQGNLMGSGSRILMHGARRQQHSYDEKQDNDVHPLGH
eukprot:758964-Pelagomonas_calceolata.AAC.2